jgi:hypothetical protein
MNNILKFILVVVVSTIIGVSLGFQINAYASPKKAKKVKPNLVPACYLTANITNVSYLPIQNVVTATFNATCNNSGSASNSCVYCTPWVLYIQTGTDDNGNPIWEIKSTGCTNWDVLGCGTGDQQTFDVIPVASAYGNGNFMLVVGVCGGVCSLYSTPVAVYTYYYYIGILL